MTEQLQVYTDCIAEYQKLKQLLTLTKSERINWLNYEHYTKTSKYKKCNRCGEIKPRSEFYGRYACCKVCKNNDAKIRYYKKRITLYQNKINECNNRIEQLSA